MPFTLTWPCGIFQTGKKILILTLELFSRDNPADTDVSLSTLGIFSPLGLFHCVKIARF